MVLVWVQIAALLVAGSGAMGYQQPTNGQTTGEKIQDSNTQAAPTKPVPDASGIYHVGNGVLPPKLIHAVDPEFPDKARKKKLSGRCVVKMVVDTQGIPQNPRIVRSAAEDYGPKLKSAAEGLDKQALEAAKLYRFEPATYQGKPVPVETTIEVWYRIY